MSKTPREILLDRHRAADSALERLCTDLLAGENRQNSTPETTENRSGERRWICRPVFWRVLGRMWQELFWCCRYVWGGLAAAWVLIIGLQMALVEDSPSGKSAVVGGASSVPSYLAVQKRLLLELGDATTPAPATRTPSPLPPTRSELLRPYRAGAGFAALSQGVALGCSIAAPSGLTRSPGVALGYSVVAPLGLGVVVPGPRARSGDRALVLSPLWGWGDSSC